MTINMHLAASINQQFKQLQDLLENLSDDQYTVPIRILSNASLGVHARHILDMYSVLLGAYENGIIDYGKRRRDPLIESDRNFAIRKLREISEDMIRPNKLLSMIDEYCSIQGEHLIISTSYFRELIYNLEHTVHHLALIRVGIEAVSDYQLPETFGVAESTQRFRMASL